MLSAWGINQSCAWGSTRNAPGIYLELRLGVNQRCVPVRLLQATVSRPLKKWTTSLGGQSGLRLGVNWTCVPAGLLWDECVQPLEEVDDLACGSIRNAPGGQLGVRACWTSPGRLCPAP